MLRDINLQMDTEQELNAGVQHVIQQVIVDPEVNPFLVGMTLQTKTKKVNAKTEEVFDGDGNPVDNEAREISHIKYVDRAKFVKVLNAAYREAFGLSSKGQRLFWLLVEELSQNHGRDFVYLNYRREFTISGGKVKLPKTSFYDGLKELQNAEFIRPKVEGKGYYWINPNLFWNGDRVKLATTYIQKHGENHPKMPKIKRPGLDAAVGRRKRSTTS